jgi:nucleoside-diphosphate-sugar epimerase
MSNRPLAPIRNVEELDERLSEPTPEVVEALAGLSGDILVLGASGKMGPTLTWMAKRASDLANGKRRVVAVARFSDPSRVGWFHQRGIETVACDLLDPDQLDRLPDAPNIVHMPAFKFGAADNTSMAWAVNTFLPGLVCRKYRGSRIVAFSTGNVYGLSPVEQGGTTEDSPLRPEGDYAMSCLGRERIFEYFSRAESTPVALVRLNYATELRYGVLVEIGRQVWTGAPVNLSMGHLNTIWQGDANAEALRSFALAASPPFVLNVTGAEVLRVRDVAERFASRLGRSVTFQGQEAADALLSDASLAHRLMGPPRVGTDEMIDLIAEWLEQGGPLLDKPTRFEVRDGRF